MNVIFLTQIFFIGIIILIFLYNLLIFFAAFRARQTTKIPIPLPWVLWMFLTVAFAAFTFITVIFLPV